MVGPVAPILAEPKVAVLVTESVPIVDVPTDSVPIVTVPVDIVTCDPNVAGPDTERVPIVAVPVDMVTCDPNVVAPRMVGTVAVLMDAVLIVAVLIVEIEVVEVPTLCVPMVAVPIVAVPVDAVICEPNVTAPVNAEAPSHASVPVLFTPEVEIWRAETPASSPLETARRVPSTMFEP
jgi:hypothetical protein